MELLIYTMVQKLDANPTEERHLCGVTKKGDMFWFLAALWRHAIRPKHGDELDLIAVSGANDVFCL